jgi:acyl carrier protein
MADEFERFKKCIVEQLSAEPESVTLEASFQEDLGADSLDITELMMVVEDEFNIQIDDEELTDLHTVGEAFTVISSKL